MQVGVTAHSDDFRLCAQAHRAAVDFTRWVRRDGAAQACEQRVAVGEHGDEVIGPTMCIGGGGGEQRKAPVAAAVLRRRTARHMSLIVQTARQRRIDHAKPLEHLAMQRHRAIARQTGQIAWFEGQEQCVRHGVTSLPSS